MIPDIELQLQVIIKSLSDNVLPAIAKDNQLAQEQMHLSLATLQIILDHLPNAHRYIRQDIMTQRRLAKDLLVQQSMAADVNPDAELQLALDQSTEILADAARGATELLAFSRQFRAVICQVIKASEGTLNQETVWLQVLQHGKESLGMGRSWNKSHGFEPDPDVVADISDLLGQS